MKPRIAPIVLLVAYFGAVTVVGLWPKRVDGPVRSDIYRFVDWTVSNGFVYMSYDLVDALANILWFIPIGTLAVLAAGRRFWFLVLIGCVLLSAGIEFLQMTALPDRVSSVSDTVANSIGAVTGVLLGIVVDQARALRTVGKRELPGGRVEPAEESVTTAR